MPVYYWSQAVGDKALLEKYADVIQQLLDGNYTHGLNLEKLQGYGVYTVLSSRANLADRLLFTTINVGGESCLLILKECIHHKDYFIEEAVLKHFIDVGTQTMANRSVTREDFKPHDALKLGSHKRREDKEHKLEMRRVIYRNQQYLVLDKQQEHALKTPFPMLITGNAGSGKTRLAIEILLQSLAAQPEGDERRSIYLCESEFLRNEIKEAWDNSPEVSHAAKDKVVFKTHDQLLMELIGTPLEKLVGEESFACWFELYAAKKKLIGRPEKKLKKKGYVKPTVAKTPEEILLQRPEDLYQEFRIISGYKKDQYLSSTLGHRGTVLGDKVPKEWLWEAYESYTGFLRDQRFIHPAFTEIPAEKLPKYYCVLADEGQELSGRQVKHLRSFAADNRLCICADSRQSSKNKLSNRPFIVSELRAMSGNMNLEPVELRYAYRCPGKVIAVADAIDLLRNKLALGLADKYENPVIEVAPERRDLGSVHWVDPLKITPEERARFDRLKESIDFAVVTLPEHMKDARKFFDTPLIFTPEEILGREFKTVAVFNICVSDIYRRANAAILERGTMNEARHLHRAKNKDQEENETYSQALNQLIVALTRAMETLILVGGNDREKNYDIRCFTEAIMQTKVITPWGGEVQVAPSSPEQWRGELEKQRVLKNEKQADDIQKKLDRSTLALQQPAQPSQAVQQPSQSQTPSPLVVPQPAPPAATPQKVVKPKEDKEKQDHDFVNMMIANPTEKNLNTLFHYKRMMTMLFGVRSANGLFLFDALINTNKTASTLFATKFMDHLKSEKKLPIDDLFTKENLSLIFASGVVLNDRLSIVCTVLRFRPSLIQLLTVDILLDVINSTNRRELSLLSLLFLEPHWGTELLHFLLLKNPALASDVVARVRALPDDHHQKRELKNAITLLLHAVDAGYIALARMLLELGVNPNKMDERGILALSITAEKGDIEMFKLLLEFNADPNLLNELGASTLQIAVKERRNQMVRLLLERGADPNYVLIDGQGRSSQTMILIASARGDIELVEMFLNAEGIEPGKIVPGYGSPLHGAAMGGHVEVVKKLLAAGLDPNTQGGVEITPLYLAAQEGHAAVVRVFLDVKKIDLSRPLYIASQRGHVEVVKLLLEKEDPNVDIGEGLTPLLAAAQHGKIEIVYLLLDRGAISSRLYTIPIYTLREIAPANTDIDSFIKDKQVGTSRFIQITASEMALVMGHKKVAEVLKLAQQGAQGLRLHSLPAQPLLAEEEKPVQVKSAGR